MLLRKGSDIQHEPASMTSHVIVECLPSQRHVLYRDTPPTLKQLINMAYCLVLGSV